MPYNSLRYISRFIVLFTFTSVLLFAQRSMRADSIEIPFYPLHIGDRWEFNGELSKVIKDTVMLNGKSYTMIVHSDTILGETRYERTDSGRVFRFNTTTMTEELLFDFTKAEGETVSVIPRQDDTIIVIFQYRGPWTFIGKERNVFGFTVTPIHAPYDNYIMIAESIGIVFYGGSDPSSSDGFTINGAVIDDELIRASYPSIYLPLQIGNYWLFGINKVSIEKDTLMPNSKKYFLMKSDLPTSMGGSIFIRQEKNYIFSYKEETNDEEVEMDFSAPSGQVYNMEYPMNQDYTLVWTSFGIFNDNIFSLDRKVYCYRVNPRPYVDASSGYAYADSFGLVKYTTGWGVDLNVYEAFVDGKHYPITSVGLQQNLFADKFSLSQNYPNPFNPTTNITYSIPQRELVTLKIFDVLGREIVTAVNEVQNSGIYNITLNAERYRLTSGLYFYQLRAKSFVETKRMLLLK